LKRARLPPPRQHLTSPLRDCFFPPPWPLFLSTTSRAAIIVPPGKSVGLRFSPLPGRFSLPFGSAFPLWPAFAPPSAAYPPPLSGVALPLPPFPRFPAHNLKLRCPLNGAYVPPFAWFALRPVRKGKLPWFGDRLCVSPPIKFIEWSLFPFPAFSFHHPFPLFHFHCQFLSFVEVHCRLARPLSALPRRPTILVVCLSCVATLTGLFGSWCPPFVS